ncbi:MAG: PAS domain-containing protein, partial [Gemmatimonadaceae bacterium]
MLAAASPRSRLVHQPDAGYPREARPLGVLIALITIALGVSGVVGAFVHWEWLLAPMAGWPQIPLLPAAELALTGAAFLALLRSDRRTTLPVAALSATVSLLCIVGAFGAFPLPLGGMALSTALLHSTISLAILIATASRSPRDEERALGVAGFVVVTMVLTMFGAIAIGVINPMMDSVVAGSSLQSLLAAFAIGAYLLGVMWASGRVTLESADWLPAGVGFASLLTVLVLWRALSFRETDQLNTLTRQAGAAQRRAMGEAVRGLANSLSRSAEWRAGGATAQQQTRDLRSLRRDFRGLEGGVFISAQSGHQVLGSTDTPLPGLDSLWAARIATEPQLADTVHYWPLDAASMRFAIVAPSCVATMQCDGAIVGVVRTQELFGTILSDTTLGFFHEIGLSDGRNASNRVIPATVGKSLLSLPLKYGVVNLELKSWPTSTTVERVRSKLPLVVLVMGGLLSILLMLTTLLGQGARRLARSREKARLASVLERSTDGIWEWDLISGAADHSSGIWHNLGYESTSEVAQRDSWMALVHPDDVDGFNRALQRHLNGEAEAFEHEYRVRSNSGEWHAMVDRARVVERTPGGQPLRLLGVRADVTETRNAHAARLLNERRFRAIFDSGFQYQLLLDREGVVL